MQFKDFQILKKKIFVARKTFWKKCLMIHEGPTPPLNTTESTAQVISELYRQNNNDPVWSIWTLAWMDSHLISIACIRITWFQYRQYFNIYNFTWKRYIWSILSLNKHRKKTIFYSPYLETKKVQNQFKEQKVLCKLMIQRGVQTSRSDKTKCTFYFNILRVPGHQTSFSM